MDINQKLLNEVKSIYQKTNSLRETAAELNLSDQKVRRLLITAGVDLKNKTTKRILSLYRAGKSPQEIAAIEGKTRNAVIAHLPYSRGPMHRWTDDELQEASKGRRINGRSANAMRVVRSRVGYADKRKDTSLRRWRKTAHLTQAGLSEKADVPISTIRAYEQKQRDIKGASAELVKRLADALHCKITDLLK